MAHDDHDNLIAVLSPADRARVGTHCLNAVRGQYPELDAPIHSMRMRKGAKQATLDALKRLITSRVDDTAIHEIMMAAQVHITETLMTERTLATTGHRCHACFSYTPQCLCAACGQIRFCAGCTGYGVCLNCEAP